MNKRQRNYIDQLWENNYRLNEHDDLVMEIYDPEAIVRFIDNYNAIPSEPDPPELYQVIITNSAKNYKDIDLRQSTLEQAEYHLIRELQEYMTVLFKTTKILEYIAGEKLVVLDKKNNNTWTYTIEKEE